jgi:hypothetical protein
MAVGRITGPLLKANLLRDGVDLAFEDDLLYLDVNNLRVGIKTSTPQYDLDVNGTTRTTNLNVTTQATLSSFTFLNNTISSTSGTINLTPSGANPVVYQGRLQVGLWNIYDSTLEVSGTNTDISINPTGTGQFKVQSDTLINGSLHATGDITADGDIQLGNQTTDNVVFTAEIASDIIPSQDNVYSLGSNTLRWNTLYANNIITSSFYTGNIGIVGNSIISTNTNGNIVLTANGSGSIILEQLKVNNNTISSTQPDQDIVLQPQGTGSVVINSTTSFKVPVGITLQRPDPASYGMIRYNSEMSRYEGYNGSYWIQLGGVGDVAGNTYITPELYPGAGDNTIRFYSNNVVMAYIDTGKFYTSVFETAGIRITDNTITTITSGDDLLFNTSGNAGVKIGNLRFYNNTITNVVTDGITTISGTGDGYFKIGGKNGVVLPAGGNADRPSIYELGMTRFNTDIQQMEVWNGLAWTGVGSGSGGGGGGNVDATLLQDIGVQSALMLG